MRVTTESTSTVIDLVSAAARSLVDSEIAFRKIQMDSDRFEWVSTDLSAMEERELQIMVSLAKRTGEFFKGLENCVTAVLTARAATCGEGRNPPPGNSYLPEEVVLEGMATGEEARKFLQDDLEKYSDLPNEYAVRTDGLKVLLGQLATWQGAIDVVLKKLRELTFLDG